MHENNLLLRSLSVCESMVGSDNRFRSLSIVPVGGGELACRLSYGTQPARDSLAHLSLVRPDDGRSECSAGEVDVGGGLCAAQAEVDEVVSRCEAALPLPPGCWDGTEGVILAAGCVDVLVDQQRCINRRLAA